MPAAFDPGLIDSLTDTALAMADAAAVETMRFFRSGDLDTRSKGAVFDPVTAGDRAGELAMRAVLHDRRPDDGVLGEELGAQAGTTGLTWVLDPIDGTRAYLAGAPTWGTLIAVNDGGAPILGLIDQPHTGERFFGSPRGAWLNDRWSRRAIAARPPRPLAEAIVMTTFPEVGTPEEGAAFRAVAERAQLTRYGLDCYAYALVAAGHVDLVIEAGLESYDIQGPMAVVAAAGGCVSDWQGGPAEAGGRVIAAANREIHAEALALLAQAK
ncbi:histidinol-phosphatase [Rhodobacteraceae bacterium CCMM004]|nr:histidinol-phosphatase [Rhodobacteraceae bacterium CCMM004]